MKISDVMVRDPVCAETWQPLSLIRQVMLENSFSYLPCNTNEGWKIVSDLELAKYLRHNNSQSRKSRMVESLTDAVKVHTPLLQNVVTCHHQVSAEEALSLCRDRPLLVLGNTDHVIGIVTAFDLL